MTTRGRSDDVDRRIADTLGDPLTECADRLRRLPESRLSAVAADTRRLVQALADAAAGVESRTAPAPPALREVPELSVFALGDQLAVTATDLAAATEELDGAEPVWWRGERQSLADVRNELAAAAQGLRARV